MSCAAIFNRSNWMNSFGVICTIPFILRCRLERLMFISVLKVPAFVGNIKKIPSAITRKPGKELVFECSDKVASQSMKLVPFHSIHWSRYAVYFRHYNNKEQLEEQICQQDEAGIAESTLDARTIDRVIVADRESETAHRMEAVNSSNGNNWRDASKGSYFMYELKVQPDTPQS